MNQEISFESLIEAIYKNNCNSVRLFENSTLICTRPDPINPLIFAVQIGNLEMITLLCRIYPDFINKPDGNGLTPIFSAIENRRADALKTLIEHGAHFTQRNSDDENILHVIIKEELIEALDFICSVVDVNSIDNKWNTPLHFAAQKGNLIIIKKLIKLKADLFCKNKSGDSVLHTALRYDQYGACKLLIGAGLGINDTNGNGDTPLHLAVAKASTKTIRLLLNHHPKKSIRNKSGDTPLSILEGKLQNDPLNSELLKIKDNLTKKSIKKLLSEKFSKLIGKPSIEEVEVIEPKPMQRYKTMAGEPYDIRNPKNIAAIERLLRKASQ